MVSEARPLTEILAFLVSQAEDMYDDDSVCSVLMLDAEGLLRNGASPRLPPDYLAAIDRLKPDPAVGTCAAAAATGKIVITRDFLSDAGWRELKHLPLALGLRAAWSVPLVGEDFRVLGTFGTYFREPREPHVEERRAVEELARIACVVIETSRLPTAV